MTDDVDLPEVMGLDRQVSLELAETSSAIAQARVALDFERQHRNRERGELRSDQSFGQVNLASLDQAQVAVLQTATLATEAAINLLVMNRTRRAREMFRLASTIVEPYSGNDAAVLATCADPVAAVGGNPGTSDGSVSPWVNEVQSLLRLASGSDRSFEPFDARATSRGWADAGRIGEPPPGVSLARLVQLGFALSATTPDDGPRTWNGLATGLDALVSDATSHLDEVAGKHWWANQTGSLFPLEPEVLMLGLAGAVWRRRGSAFGVGNDGLRVDREPPSRLAFAVSVAAARLVSDEEEATG